MKHLLFIFVIVPFFCNAQHTLTIEAEGIQSSDGYIGVALYNADTSFLKKGKTCGGAFEPAKEGTTTITITDLPEGTYAVSLFHDKNGNKELDTNFIGIPKEPVAFSKAKMKMFGPPSFEDCSFQLTSDFEIKIPIK